MANGNELMAGAGERVKEIHIRGARQHNLKNLEVWIPRDQLVVITGVSGSGKSSLAFDTLYAEGHRKYMDSLSPRARQVLDQIPRPDVDFIHGLSPVIAIEQRTGGETQMRATVASVAEIADYARLLWSVCGEPVCPLDGGRVRRFSLDDSIERLFQEAEESRLVLLAPLGKQKAAVWRDEFTRIRQKGFQRIRLNGEIRDLDEPRLLPPGSGEPDVDLVVDRLVIRKEQRSRLADSLELAFAEGRGRAIAWVQKDKDTEWKEIPLSLSNACETCGTHYPEITPRLFSSNHSEGACPYCKGQGRTLQFREDLIVTNPSLSVKQGALSPFRSGKKSSVIRYSALFRQLAEQMPFDYEAPWETLPESIRQQILNGVPNRLFDFNSGRKKDRGAHAFPGVVAWLTERLHSKIGASQRARLSSCQAEEPCPVCKGEKLSPFASAVRVAQIRYPDFLKMTVRDAARFLQGLQDGNSIGRELEEVMGSLRGRMYFLQEVGLGYLQLNREYNTLSGGEAQRVRLASQLGMGLVGVLYILDEPSVGLHPQDHARLIRLLRELQQRGNSVVVVEHDYDMMRAADYLLEIGPGAGREGGELLFAGSREGMEQAPRSLTGPFLKGTAKIEHPSAFKGDSCSHIKLRGARGNNLKNVNLDIPLGRLVVVSGVSGSGKSTLINDTLGRALAMKLNGSKEIPEPYQQLEGADLLQGIICVDQHPIGRSPRSNPATFTKLFDPLRALFAEVPLAKVRGYNAGRFSFNIRGGRCERCQGEGGIPLDLQFLPDVYTVCPSCAGKRYNRETLDVRFKGYSIADVLEMRVSDAAELFRFHPKIHARLEMMQAVGLGYLQLGQAAPTLSGGEAQRLKLAAELNRKNQGGYLYLLDEPTTGLHSLDVQKLLELLFQLRDAGNTVVVIEHHLDVIALADWLIELGPGGGDMGGELLYAGPPALCPHSTPTGKCLAKS
jgi:excinuclease ABC subunit A